MSLVRLPLLCVACCLASFQPAFADEPALEPLFVTVDLNIGETQAMALRDGRQVRVKLLDVSSRADGVRGAVRESKVRVEIDGEEAELAAAMYRLPTKIGDLWIDCPVTKDYLETSNKDAWALDADARLRLWPGDSPWIRPGTFGYPTPGQRWFATDTQMANDPCYVNGCEKPTVRSIYYHYGLDIGGAEGLVEVVAATDGLVVSVGNETLEEHKDGTPVAPRYDVVYIVDQRGWYYRYSHLAEIDEGLKVGQRIQRGTPIGLLGKEGGSGGWSHLHFGISAMQPSGRYGSLEGYAFFWQAYQAEHPRPVQAVARPHILAMPGEEVTLDGTRSVAWNEPKGNRIEGYTWLLEDGTTADGATLERSYDTPGSYCEMLKVEDAQGNVDYDMAVVQVWDPERPDELAPTIHACYYPTLGIRPGDEITFKVRTFNMAEDEGEEAWDFGDGSPEVTTQSDGCAKGTLNPDGYAVTTHRYEKSGHYLVTVSRTNARGETATARLHVRVE